MDDPKVEKSARGFSYWEEFETTYGHKLQVGESSAAMGPHLWLRVNKDEPVHGGELPAANVGVHLNLSQALRLRRSLDAAIKKQVADWQDVGSYLSPEERDLLGIRWLRVSVEQTDLSKDKQREIAIDSFFAHFGYLSLHLRPQVETLDMEPYIEIAGIWDVQYIHPNNEEKS
jgi:hypothetical protein